MGSDGLDERIDEEVTQSDLVHERLRESPLKRWILLDGNRYVLAAGLAAVVFLACTSLGVTGYVPVTDPETATTLVASIVGGTLPFITIVLAINQLVLTQELGWPGDLEERYESMVTFRREVESLTGSSVSPAAPAEFLRSIVEATVERTETLRSVAAAHEDPRVASRLEDLVDAIADEGEIVTSSLEGTDFGTFETLSAVLGHFNGAHLYAARTISADHAADLPDEAEATLECIVELLGYVAIARQTFKTLYMQYELAHLSQLLLVVGFPTLLGGGLFTMVYGSIVEAIGDPTVLVLAVSTAVTVVFLPFIVLLVYTFRIASIASRTADFGPFVPRVDLGGQ